MIFETTAVALLVPSCVSLLSWGRGAAAMGAAPRQRGMRCQIWGGKVSDTVEVLSVRRYKAGYEVRTEEIIWGDDNESVVMKSAYTVPEGHYIGSSVWAHRLIVRRGIKPEPREPACAEANGGRGRTCSIGFCAGEQKWYGWSHRALYGFGIGDIVKEGDLCASSGWTDEYLVEHPEDDLSLPVGFVARTLADMKRMAVAFAESVS